MCIYTFLLTALQALPKGAARFRETPMPSSDPPADGAAITFRVIRSPAGWRIQGAESLAVSTIYLSLEAALAQTQSMADVLARHGYQARVIVDPDVVVD